MPISAAEVVVGGIYATATNQHRRVSNIVRGKVYYDTRGGNVMNKWAPGPPKSSSPSVESFAAACDKVISKPATGKAAKKGRKKRRKKTKSKAKKRK
jgi:hypothetical protein